MINIPLSKQYRTIAGHVSIWNDAILIFIVHQWQVQYADYRSQVRLEDRSLYNGK